MNMPSMAVDLKSVQFNGNHAEATVSIYAKTGTSADGMVMTYQLEHQGNKWVVTDRKDTGGMPHSGAAPAPGGAMPGMSAPQGGANPHGGAAMPSPSDLPPAGAKK